MDRCSNSRQLNDFAANEIHMSASVSPTELPEDSGRDTANSEGTSAGIFGQVINFDSQHLDHDQGWLGPIPNSFRQ